MRDQRGVNLPARKFRYSLRRASSCVQRGSVLRRVLMCLMTAMVSGGTPRLMFPALAKVRRPWHWTPAVVAATPSWWLAGAFMPFAGAVAACLNPRTLGRYCPAFRWVAASFRCRTRRSVLGSRVLSRIRGSGWCLVCSARRSDLGIVW